MTSYYFVFFTGSTHLIRPENFLNDTGDLTRVTEIHYGDADPSDNY